MSSTAVRDAFKNFISAAAAEPLVDFDEDGFLDLKDLMEEYSISPDAAWMGIQFIGQDEVPVTVPATNAQGMYRETGAVYIHIVDVAKLGAGANIRTRGESLIAALRNQRLGIGQNILVESITPLSFADGATLRFEDGWIAASFLVGYQADFNI